MDASLVVRAQRGDQRAFELLAASLIGRLHGIAFGILRDHAAADDATQQAIIGVWRDLPRLRDPDRFEAWSYRMVVNRCNSATRDDRRRLPSIGLEVVEPQAPDTLREVDDRDQVDRGLRHLSVDQRAVIVLCHYLDLPAAEVAEVLDIPLGTVHSRLHRAMAALRAAIDADERSVAVSSSQPEAVR